MSLLDALIAVKLGGGGGGGGGESAIAWKPTVAADGTISWTRTNSTTKPADQNIKGPKGDTGNTGEQGPKGDTGQAGEAGPAGPGVPSGGTAGQILVKSSSADYDAEWTEQTAGGAAVTVDLSNKTAVVSDQTNTVSVMTESRFGAAAMSIGDGTGSSAALLETEASLTYPNYDDSVAPDFAIVTDEFITIEDQVRFDDMRYVYVAGSLGFLDETKPLTSSSTSYVYKDLIDRTTLILNVLVVRDPNGTIEITATGSASNVRCLFYTSPDVVIPRVQTWLRLNKYALNADLNSLRNAIPTNVSDLTNDSGYQNATQVQAAINAAVEGITGFDYEVVQALPQTGEKGKIYLVDAGTTGSSVYNEYIWMDGDPAGRFELIGTTEIDLSNYYNKAEVDARLDNKADASTVSELTSGLAAKQDALVSGMNIKTVANQSLLGSGDVEFKTINNSSISGSGNLNTGKVAADPQSNSISIYEGTDNSIQISKVDNDTIRVQGYGVDDRGATRTLYDMSLANKGYVDSKAGVNIAVGKETWYGTYTDENDVTYQVYTKTIYIPALPDTAGVTRYDHGVSNIKQILQVYGFTTDGFVLNAPRQNVEDNIAIYQASKSASNQTVAIEVGKDRSSKAAYVTLVYAKNN